MRDRAGAHRVLVFPGKRGVHYLSMLHRAPEEAGFEMVAAKVKSLYSDAAVLRGGDVLHVHWTQPIAQEVDSEEKAWASVAAFKQLVDGLRHRGVRVVWTVHNRLPHQMRFLEPELALSQFLADSSDRIHIMSPETPEVVADLYRLPPDKVHHIPHPSYQGVHEASVPRERARDMLGLSNVGPTALFFGRMHPYKGVDTLLKAIAVMGDRGLSAPTLLLAGNPKTQDERAEIEAMLPVGSPVVTHFEHVEDSDIPTWFSAADVAVFPFRAILNSGSVHLSATLGVPVILPGEPHLRSQFRDEPWVRYYDPEDAAASLADLLAHPDETDHSESMARFSERLAPEKVSQQYLDMLRELVPSSEQKGTGLLERAKRYLRRN